ncbi:MAG: DegQ family serine endoprotease [Gammaproteobacteria bacterium]|nr:DegQ family serine endoprotease [Gammaproteobacteria bacterium]MBU2677297.1 DegQ family serine endoprotease [Gammaproteobacteria bacterium]NNC57862.1 DegQ family serine endoprotease [Woeseiaceae bacterium]NNL51028.1 DegQ family serine endoprotease [Woeseiaceae bacterium]
MTTIKTLWSGLLVAALALATAHAALPDSVGGRPVISLAPLVEAASPAVVNIRVSQTVSRSNPLGDDAFRRFFGIPDSPHGPREVASAGSGVIVDAERGYILTNHHVVADADTIQISLIDGKILDAEIVGSDPATDIAVIKVEGEGLIDMPIGNSEGARVGDFVIAIGNPFGLGHTVTSGIISALGRTGISRDGYEDFIQTDASINPGNSGGALVNMNGELIGINSAIISRSGGNVGIGFAVPTEIASSIMGQILDFGEIRRGLLGVGIQTIDAEMAKALDTTAESGALITNIVPKSAAEEAGLEVGDIIVEVNQKKVDDASQLRNTIGLMRSGDEVAIKYVRNSKTRSTKALLGQAQSQQLTGADIHPGLEGAVFAAASTTSDNGIEVAEVEPGSPAAQRGLRPGDVITAVNRTLVRNLEDLAAIAENNRILFLLVQRGDRSLMLQIR